MKRKLSWLLIITMIMTLLPFNFVVYAEPATDLIISEYLEGAGYNKAIEIYNGTGEAVDLSEYTYRKDKDGDNNFNKTISLDSFDIPLTNGKKLLAHDETLVIINPQADDELKAITSYESGNIDFNGDDQVQLLHNGQVIDHIGVPGDINYGKDASYVRAAHITTGNTDLTAGALKDNPAWIKGPKTQFNTLGYHISVNNTKVMPVNANAPSGSELTAGTKVSLTTMTSGAAIFISFEENDVYGDYQEQDSVIVNNDIKFKAKATKSGLEDSKESFFEYTVQSTIETVKIQAVRDAYTDSDNNYIDDNGKTKVEGVVSGIIPVKNATYIFFEDDTAGLGLNANGLDQVAIGDKISVVGTLAQDHGFAHIMPNTLADVAVIENNLSVVATEVNHDGLNDSVEGQLVKLSNVKITDVNEFGEANYEGAPDMTIIKEANGVSIDSYTNYASITGVLHFEYGKFILFPVTQNDLEYDPTVVRNVTSSHESGLISKGTAVTLSSETEGASIYYTLDGTDPTVSSTLYTDPIIINENVEIKAIATKDTLTNSHISIYNYTASESVGAVTISQIQGENHTSPFVNDTVENVTGIITAQLHYEFERDQPIIGFYLQGESDNNDATSDAIFVKSNATVAIGDKVSVNGLVVEQVKEKDFYAYNQENQLAVTTINATDVTILSSDNELPAPIVLGQGGRVVPHDQVSSENFSTYDINTYAIDFYESLECMRVTMNNPLVVAQNVNNKISIAPDFGAIAQADGDLNIHGGIVVQADDVNTEILSMNQAILSNGFQNINNVVMGDKLSGPVVGILEYEWDLYQIYLTEKAPAAVDPKVIDDVYKYEISDDELRVGSFNVYNHGGDDSSSKTNGIADQIVNLMKSPDIITLVEVQDSDGKENTNIVDASVTYQNIINAVATKGGPNYLWTDIPPVDDAEGGEPGGNIRVGFLYNPSRVSLKEGTKGGSQETVSVDTDGHLTLNPGRIAATASAFENTRKSLAAEFVFRNEEVIVIGNHLKSKGGDNGIYGNIQPPVLTTESKRTEQAQLVNDFIDSVLATNPDANIVVCGDFNDYHYSAPIEALKGGVLDNMIDTLPLNEQFTYMFNGNSQVLDHILVSQNLTNQSKADVININSMTPKKKRHSDHDPVVVAISGLGDDNYVNGVSASTSGTVAAGTEVTLTSEGAEKIYYSTSTLDLDNLENNTLYSAPIVINETTTIQAVAVKGEFVSSISTFEFDVKIPGTVITVEEARSLPSDTEVTLDVIVTAQPGAFGYKAFTFQDDTAAGYVHTSSLDDQIIEGSHVLLKGTTTEYNGMFQIKMQEITLLDPAPMVNKTIISLTDLSEENEAKLVQVRDVILSNLEKDDHGNSILTLSDGENTAEAKLDARSGFTYEQMSELVTINSKYHITGIVHEYKDTYTLKIRKLVDVQSNEVPTLIEEARTFPIGTKVVIDAVVTSKPGAFGYKAFTFQDSTAAGYIHTSTLDENIVEGSHVKIIGTTHEHNGMFQINMDEISLLPAAEPIEAQVITVGQVGEAFEAQLIKLENVSVNSISSDKYNNTLMTVTDGDNTVSVKLDSRSGESYSDVAKILGQYDTVNFTGIIHQNDDYYQVKIRSIQDIEVITKKVSVEEARALPLNSKVILDVIVTAQPGAFGNKAFTFQDDTAAGYVHTYDLDDQFVEGSHVLLKGTTKEYKGMFQVSMEEMTMLEDAPMIEKTIIDASGLSETNEAKLVEIKNITLTDLQTDEYGNSILTLDDQTGQINAKLDARSGFTYNQVEQLVTIGSNHHVSGIVHQSDDTYTLKIRKLDDIHPITEISSISDAKLQEDNSTVSLDVIIVKSVGADTYSIKDDSGYALAQIISESDLAQGEHIILKGKVQHAFNELLVTDTSFTLKNEQTEQIAEVITLDQVNQDYLGHLISIENTRVGEIKTLENNVYEVILANDTQTASLFVQSDISIYSKINLDFIVDVEGIVSKTSNETYAICLEDLDDLTVVTTTANISSPVFKDLNQNIIDTIQKNSFVNVEVTANNPLPTVGVVQFKLSKDDTMIKAGYFNKVYGNNQIVSFGFDTFALESGTYELEFFYWTNIKMGEALAQPVRVEITIE